MPAPRKKLILDTNITHHLYRLYRADANHIMHAVTQRFKVVATSETFCEILYGFSKDDRHFESAKARFKLMVGKEQPVFLRLPFAFAMRAIFNLEWPTTVGPALLLKGYRSFIHAKSKDELFNGDVRLPNRKGQICRFDADEFQRIHEQGMDQHKSWLRRIQDGKDNLGPPVEWAATYASMMGLDLDSDQLIRFAQGLNAVYTFSTDMCQKAQANTYNFDKHESDYGDLQQLHFLSDPDIHLLTDDRPLNNRIKGSSQDDRVLPFKTFLIQHGFTVRH